MKSGPFLLAALVALGMLAHFCKRLYDLETAGTILSPIAYARLHPYGVAMAVIGGYLLAAVLFFAGQLNESMAIMTGVACSEGFDTLRARAVGRMKDDGGSDP